MIATANTPGERNVGICFEQGAGWKQILAMAKKENKYIFVDCYTSWCAPCKFMNKHIFPQEEVGTFFNDKFISVKVQMDTAKNDNDEIRAWYRTARSMMNEHNVTSFPTYLFFSPDGKLVHRSAGATATPQEFIDKAEDALDTARQYYTQLAAWRKGKKDTAIMKRLALTALELDDRKTAGKLAADYIATLADYYTTENLLFISKFANGPGDKGFELFLHHPAEVNAVMGKNFAEERAMNVMIRSEPVIRDLFKQDKAQDADWDSIHIALSEKYPASFADRVLSWIKAPYYEKRGDWQAFAQYLDTYIHRYDVEVQALVLNNYAWNIFLHASDKQTLAIALGWSRRTLYKEEKDVFIDTYANLLYKIGDVANAMAWEEKAIKMNPGEKAYQQALEKMRKSEQTWE